MREYYLVDEIGSNFFFDNRCGALLVNVEGVGVIRDNTYLNFAGTYKLASSNNPLVQISGTIIFLKGYAGYTNFLNYLKKARGALRLFYKADNLKYAYVQVSSLTKTELEFGVLQCNIVFDKLSMWLNKVNHTINANESSSNKVFPYIYPFTYSSSFNGEITVQNNGCTKAPVRIEIIGKTNNPFVEIIKDGEVISKMRLLVTTSSASDLIVVDAEAPNQEMSKTTGNTKIDIYQYQDFTCDNFLYLPVGSFRIKFEPGVSEKTLCKFSFIEMFEGN